LTCLIVPSVSYPLLTTKLLLHRRSGVQCCQSATSSSVAHGSDSSSADGGLDIEYRGEKHGVVRPVWVYQ